MADKRIDEATGVETVGHEWDGIEELNNPLPRWWLIVLWATVVFAAGYVVAYPAWPMVAKATDGVLGWSSRGQLEQELSEAAKGRQATLAAVAAMPLEQIAANADLQAKAIAGGKAAFQVNCVQCHGSGGKSAPGNGYPNLTDDDWLWGGNIKEIEYTVTHGVRSPGSAQTRTSLMPNFGKDGVLTAAQIDDVASYLLALGKGQTGGAAARNGAATFAANCAVCHGADAKGMRQFGAPNLTDAVWLYGGKREQIAASINKAHAGVMPAWGGKLDPVTIKMLATYVHSLGGGEDFTEAPATPAAEGGNAQP